MFPALRQHNKKGLSNLKKGSKVQLISTSSNQNRNLTVYKNFQISKIFLLHNTFTLKRPHPSSRQFFSEKICYYFIKNENLIKMKYVPWSEWISLETMLTLMMQKKTKGEWEGLGTVQIFRNNGQWLLDIDNSLTPTQSTVILYLALFFLTELSCHAYNFYSSDRNMRWEKMVWNFFLFICSVWQTL